MAQDSDIFDCFVSYARRDNGAGWISGFVEELQAEHRKFSGGRELTCFFDKHDISSLSDWREQIFNKGLARSRLFLAFISPSYFASEWCRREWRAWIDLEIAKHILTAGAAPIYIVEVPGFVGRNALSEQEVAQKVADLCGVPAPHDAFRESVSPVVKQLRNRQLSAVQPFYDEGVDALRRADLREVLQRLARDLDERAQDVRRAAESESDVPPYNKRFSGRLDELLALRNRLKDDRAGVISGIHGLGGIGKSELAFTYAHAFASAYPGGRFLVPCEGQSSLRQATLHLGNHFRDQIGDEERKLPETYFAAISRGLRDRLDELGHILLVLDNVTDAGLLRAEQTDLLTALGPQLHLLATTRLPPAGQGSWLTLGELPPADALELLEKHRPFADGTEREAARSIVRRLGGFALAVELVAAWLAAHESATYAGLAAGLGLQDLDTLAEDKDVELRRHNHERRLRAVLDPTLAGLSPAQLRALEYASLLPPDYVPLPWLRALVIRDFPELTRAGRLDPWQELWRRLMRLALFSRGEGETIEPRLVRVHRLVQDLVRISWTAEITAARQQQVDALLCERDAALEQTTRWQDARWELEPLDALALLWADTGHKDAAWLLNQAGVRWHALAEWVRAEPLMRRALAIDERCFGTDDPKVASKLNNVAQLFQETNRLADAEPLMERVVAIFEKSLGQSHPNVAAALNNLGQLLQATNRVAEAEPLMRRALAIDEQSFGAHHPNVARDLNNLATLLRATNRLAEAEPLVQRALAIDEESFGKDHPHVANGLNNLPTLFMATNRLAEAEPLMRRALAIDEQSFGKDHPKVAGRLNNLAQLLQATNRLGEAEPLMRRALAIDEQSFGAHHPNVARDLSNLAWLLQATNRLAEAEPPMWRALAIIEKSLGQTHTNVATALNNLALLLKATNRLAEAEPLMRRALAIDEQSFGQDHPDVARDLNNLARLLQTTNRLADAERLMRRAVEIFRDYDRSTGHQHPHMQAVIRNYGAVLEQMGLPAHEIEQRIRAVLT